MTHLTGEVEDDLGPRPQPHAPPALARSASTTVIGRPCSSSSGSRLCGFAPWRGWRASTTVTSAPAWRSASARFDPMNPSPPVTTTRRPSNAPRGRCSKPTSLRQARCRTTLRGSSHLARDDEPARDPVGRRALTRARTRRPRRPVRGTPSRHRPIRAPASAPSRASSSSTAAHAIALLTWPSTSRSVRRTTHWRRERVRRRRRQAQTTAHLPVVRRRAVEVEEPVLELDRPAGRRRRTPRAPPPRRARRRRLGAWCAARPSARRSPSRTCRARRRRESAGRSPMRRAMRRTTHAPGMPASSTSSVATSWR